MSSNNESSNLPTIDEVIALARGHVSSFVGQPFKQKLTIFLNAVEEEDKIYLLDTVTDEDMQGFTTAAVGSLPGVKELKMILMLVSCIRKHLWNGSLFELHMANMKSVLPQYKNQAPDAIVIENLSAAQARNQDVIEVLLNENKKLKEEKASKDATIEALRAENKKLREENSSLKNRNSPAVREARISITTNTEVETAGTLAVMAVMGSSAKKGADPDPVRVKDAILYLGDVKMEYGSCHPVYNKFCSIMKRFKSREVDTPGVIARVTKLFRGRNHLLLGFDRFLPNDYKISREDLKQMLLRQQKEDMGAFYERGW